MLGVAHDGVAEWVRGKPGHPVLEARFPDWVDAFADAAEVSGRCVEGDPWLHPSDAAQSERPPPGRRAHLQHRPYRLQHAGKLVYAGRQHADNGVTHSVERDVPAKRGGRTTQSL